MLVWSEAIAIGVPDELFWRMSLPEFDEIIERVNEREDAQNKRAGLIAASIVNVHRRRGKPAVKPSDFFRKRRKEILEPDDAVVAMDAWAAAHNASLRAAG